MDEIQKYLDESTKQLQIKNFCVKKKSTNKKVAVIVEPRNHQLLQSVVYNVMNSLGEEWNLHIFSHDQQFVQSLFPNWEYQLSLLQSNNLTVKQYNTLFQSKQFWESIHEETVLIFQTDSFIMNPDININQFLKYSFIGGIYRYITTNELKEKYPNVGYTDNYNLTGIQLHNSPKLNFSINGGFSLRKKSVMINCLEKISYSNIIEYRQQNNMNIDDFYHCDKISEDVYFQNAIDLLGYELPDKQTCIDFCENLSYTKFNPNSFAIHNFNKINKINNFKESIQKKFSSKNTNVNNKLKIYIVGHKGWIGNMYQQECENQQIKCVFSNHRAESKEILQDILDTKSTHVLCCMGRTHGTFKGKQFTTIDYLEYNETLPINLNDNLYSPLKLANFCDKHKIHFTYIGTGCIYQYDETHTIENKVGFTEEDLPNFFGSNYSIVKGYTNNLMKSTNALHLRIRMPITDSQNPRNFITKITTYEKICSIQNSMTVLTELIPLSIKMMLNRETGTFNFTNPGTISHNEILQMYQNIVDPTFTWKNFTIEEQDKVLLGKRSNNLLDTTKLESKYSVMNIHESVYKCLVSMSKQNNKRKVFKIDKNKTQDIIKFKKIRNYNGSGIFIQVGSGAGDLDKRSNYRDGFTEFIKSLPREKIKKIILIEPNPLNIPLLKECWKDYKEAVIYEYIIIPKYIKEHNLKLYYCPDDKPHYQVASINKEHIYKHYGRNCVLKNFNLKTAYLEDFINNITNEEIDLLALDIEGIDAEVILDLNFKNINIKFLSFEHIHLESNKNVVISHLIKNNFSFIGNGMDHNGFDYLYEKNSKYKKQNKKIDCFTFYNELDMLDFRLDYLYNSVDYFVLVESTFSHSGNKKELYYKKNKKRFEIYHDKIIHVIVEDMPNTNNAWDNESHQRRCIDRGISKLNLTDNDILIISDLDEIIDRNTLSKINNFNGIMALKQDLYYYNVTSKFKKPWFSAKILNYKTYCNLNKDPQKIRHYSDHVLNIIEKGGWHFSYFGNTDFIKNKIKNFAHQELNKSIFLDDTYINDKINKCMDLYGRNFECIKINIEDNTYLPENYSKYKIFKINEISLNKNDNWYQKKGKYIFPLEKRIEKIHNRLTIKYGNIKDEDVEQMLCLKHIKGDEKILEIGGNIGRVSCVLSTILNDETNLVVLECHPKHVKELIENRDLNNFKFHIEGSALSKQKLYQYGWNTYTIKEKNSYNIESQKLMTEINIIDYEDILQKYNIQFDTLILDCEGSFFYIIQEFPEILKNITKIIIENDYPSYDRKLFVDNLLIKKGFQSVERVPLDKKHWWKWKNQNIRDNFYEVWIK